MRGLLIATLHHAKYWWQMGGETKEIKLLIAPYFDEHLSLTFTPQICSWLQYLHDSNFKI